VARVPVNIYTLYIHDDRCSEPSLYMATLADDARALEIARGRLANSSHYLKVEVLEGDRLVAVLSRGDAVDSGP
jgi:hypothetical protein